MPLNKERRKKKLKSETVSRLIAAQTNAIRTNHIKMADTQKKRRVYQSSSEKMDQPIQVRRDGSPNPGQKTGPSVN